MIITRRIKSFFAAGTIFFNLIIISAVPQVVLADDPPTTRPADLVCDPLPEDFDLLDQCLHWNVIDPIENNSPGTPSVPISNTGISGVYGVSGAYDSITNTYLVVGGEAQGGVGKVYGTILDANTHAIIVPKFRVDENKANARHPLAVFNPKTAQFFVVWEDGRRGGSNKDNYARIINADGSVLGNEFLVANNALFDDLDFDAKYNRYLVTSNTGGVSLRAVDAAGTVGAQINLDPATGNYTGQASLAINSDLNEYWVTYIESIPVAKPCTRCEDNRVYLVRLNAETLEVVGERILVSIPNPQVLITDPSIAHDPVTGAALVVWMDYGDSGIMGRLVNNNLTLGSEKSLLTPMTDITATLFTYPNVSYHPVADLFYLSSRDDNGGTRVSELTSDIILSTSQVIVPFQGSVQTAPNHIDTGKGTIAISSTGSQIKLGTVLSPKVTMPEATVLGESVGSNAFAPNQLGNRVSQIYLYALGLAGLLAVLLVIIGGYLVVTAGTNVGQAAKGKEFLYSSLIGLVILLASYLILAAINPDLVRF